jgi:hypothetical protein
MNILISNPSWLKINTEKIIEKWTPIILILSKGDPAYIKWLCIYAEYHSLTEQVVNSDPNTLNNLDISLKVASKLNLHNCYIDCTGDPKDTNVYQIDIEIPIDVANHTNHNELIVFCEELLVDKLADNINKQIKNMQDNPEIKSIIIFKPYRIVQSVAIMQDGNTIKCVMTSRYNIIA